MFFSDSNGQISDIINNIHCIFNTRQGTIPGRESFGLPDLTDVYAGFPNTVDDFLSVIKKSINAFEPRLYRVDVLLQDMHKENNVIVSLEIKATLSNNNNFFIFSKFGGNGRSEIGILRE